jgi:hypothetical protein
MNETIGPVAETEEAAFVRVPGLLRRWEIEQLLEPGCVLHVEEAGAAEDGTPLFAVYRQEEGRP